MLKGFKQFILRGNVIDMAVGVVIGAAFATVVGAFHRQAAKAERYGLTDEHSAATYVYTAWLMGEEFDTRIPAIAQILNDRRMKAMDKAKALANCSRLVFRTLSAPASVTGRRSAA